MSGDTSYILGISAFYHDSAACLLRDGEILAAAQEERFTRQKGDASFPENAIEFCLRRAGISVADLSYVGFYDKPFLKFERILESYLGVTPRGFASFVKAAPLWVKQKLYMEKTLRDRLHYGGEILYTEHHESHAASAFFPSPFEAAAILTMDGVGEWATASFGVGRGNKIELFKELRWPDSLGLLYSAFTYFAGFKVNSGEYKVMGLAPYGEPKYVDVIYRELMDLREDGSFTLNQKYFNYLTGLTMTSGAFTDLFGGPPRVPESKLTQREMDLARSIQDVCEEVMLRMARTAHRLIVGGLAVPTTLGPVERAWMGVARGISRVMTRPFVVFGPRMEVQLPSTATLRDRLLQSPRYQALGTRWCDRAGRVPHYALWRIRRRTAPTRWPGVVIGRQHPRVEEARGVGQGHRNNDVLRHLETA